jgi:hypothetical protein
MSLLSSSFQRTSNHWSLIFPYSRFPQLAGKKMGTIAGTRVLCTQYPARVTTRSGETRDNTYMYLLADHLVFDLSCHLADHLTLSTPHANPNPNPNPLSLILSLLFFLPLSFSYSVFLSILGNLSPLPNHATK